MADEGRESLLKHDETIAIPEKEKGLAFDQSQDDDKYNQNDIDDILKMFNP
ncbi:hypothetical protein SAMN05444156_1473 [Verrucomicrobium sp. GAS474]|uniref:hypothetical protein n=1 Tax=Verrucomicrobium sp. GAS474 TaxID=1882831 RepID=UPI00087D2DC2|nr:hypothetical protein [Verrucomicrobium sp. GAS474]SDU01831.1 hypothetical protein SAMN05444156_1473 [Verrucomicrobium sp. GAS474]